MRKTILSCTILVSIFFASATFAEALDLTQSVIIVPANAPADLRDAATIFREEASKRGGLNWPLETSRPDSGAAITFNYAAGGELPAESFRIKTGTDGGPVIISASAADARGALYAAGELLRKIQFSDGKAGLPAPINVTVTPRDAIRGHQIGYRNRANSWDAWTLDQFDQHFRELALAGDNCVENIPFQGVAGPHMKFTREQMNVEFGKLADKYHLDHWVWLPIEFNLEEEDGEAFLDEQEAFYKAVPRLDAIFVPGGDPGHNHPRLVMDYMAKMAERAKKYHPEVELWISLQGFSVPWIADFYAWLDKHDPAWFTGVVAGPSSPPIPETRKKLAAKYKLRRYPDITHTTRCQYPVDTWDPAFAMTEGREVSNPRPVFYTEIYNKYAPYADGFLTYSDGVHDDLNKFLWSRLAWNPQPTTREILVDYANFYFGRDAERIAAAILSLERNWDGPIDANGSIDGTLALWQNLEADHPELADNWRWQLGLLRAYYDAYTRHRLIYEEALEVEAMALLGEADDPAAVMDEALAIVQRAGTERVRSDLRSRIVELCEALYRSIGLQTSVEKHQASGAERGAVLDFLDYPLNNRWWLEDQFAEIEKLDADTQRERLQLIANWDNPGPGSFYDNAGRVGRCPRIDDPSGFTQAWWDNGMSRARLSWQVYLDGPFNAEYIGLDPEAEYTLRICGETNAIVHMDGILVTADTFERERGGFKTYSEPQKLIADGELKVSWSRPDERAMNWRQYSKVFDIWLLKHQTSD